MTDESTPVVPKGAGELPENPSAPEQPQQEDRPVEQADPVVPLESPVSALSQSPATPLETPDLQHDANINPRATPTFGALSLDEGEPEEKVITDQQIHDKNLFSIWIDSVTKSFKNRLKEHPRVNDNMDRLNEMLKEAMETYILHHQAPPDNSPTKEEIENTMSGATTSKPTRERPVQ